MTVLLVLLGAGAGAIGGWLGCHRWHRTRTANAEHQAAQCDWFRDRADQLADELDHAGRLINRLRDIVGDQAVIVRTALGRPQKRRIPGGTP